MPSHQVLLSLESISRNDEGMPVSIKTTCGGMLTRDNGAAVIQYEDHVEDGVGGAPIVRQVKLRMEPGRVEIYQIGDFAIPALILVQGQRCAMQYRTPYGDMDMGVFASLVNVEETATGGTAHLKYQIESCGTYVSSMEMKVRYIRSDGIRS